ncbi:tRNA lysidine(34) synthetase TilS [Halomonas sediminis]
MSVNALLDDALADSVPGRIVWVALSGGLDSSLLLTLAARACHRHARPLYALHVNHGLQAAAAGFEIHCRRLCSRLGVPLYVEHVQVESAGQGIEDAARKARYGAFSRRVRTGDTLLLAQHQTDQAETFLLAALRGSGVRGLAAMPAVRQWHGARLVRPWLAISRARLKAEAEIELLAWVEDPTNQDRRLSRNFLRQAILPRLELHWPQAVSSLAQAAKQASEADALLDELAEMDLQAAGGEPSHLMLASLLTLSRARQRLLIRYACQQLGLATPPRARLETLLEQLEARHDAQPLVAWEQGEARVWKGRLYLSAPLQALPAGWQAGWDGRSRLVTPLGTLALVAHEAPEPSLCATALCETMFEVRLRGGGEVLMIPGRGRRDLKRLLQESELPPWERKRLLIVTFQGVCVAVLRPPGEVIAQAAGWRFRPA